MSVPYDRDILLRDLRENVIEVTFTKVNGESRVMRCSLKPEVLPESYSLTEEPKERDFHSKNPNVISCWDVQSNGWRSFRIDSVKYVQVIDAF